MADIPKTKRQDKRQKKRRSNKLSSRNISQPKKPARRSVGKVLKWLHSRFEPLAYWLTLIYIFTIPFEKMYEIEGVGTISRLAGIPLLGLWLFVIVLKPNIRKLTAFHWCSLLYVAICGMSFFWSVSEDRTSVTFLTYVQLYLVTLFIWFALNNDKRCFWATVSYLTGAWIVVFLIFYNFYMNNVSKWEGRVSVAGSDANETALILVLGMSVAWYLATSIHGFGPSRLTLKLLAFSYIPAAVVALVMTGSRGGVLSTIPVVLYVLVSFMKMKISSKLVLILLIVGSIIVSIPYLPEKQIERISTTTESLESADLNSRADMWRLAFSVWQTDSKTVLVGTGAGSFSSINLGHGAHSSHVSVLVQTGLLGFIAYFLIILVLFRVSWRSPPEDRYFLLAILGSWLIGASALTWEYRKPTWVVWSLIACIAYTRSQTRARGKFSKRRI